MRPRISAILTVCLLFSWTLVATADVIDFEQFEIGDGLTEINAVYSPQGIHFLTEGGVGDIQMVGGSKVFAAFTPNANAFDILINFDFQVDEVGARFLNNGGASSSFSVLEGYDEAKLPGPPPDTTGFLFSVFGGANIDLSYSWPGPGVSLIRTLHFSQDLANNDFVTIDNVQFSQVPEPSQIGFLIFASLVGCLRRRPHVSTSDA